MHKFEDFLDSTREVGYVEEVVASVVLAAGLPGVRIGEMVIFETSEVGKVTALREDRVEILVFTRGEIKSGTRVARTGEFLEIEIGEWVMGKTIDSMARVIGADSKREVKSKYLVDVLPVGIASRRRVDRPLETGVVALDTIVPLGRGQRELVMGDRKTGKSQAILQMMLSQAKAGTVCIYTAIGQRKTEIKRVEQFGIDNKIMDKMVIVAAASQDSPAEIYEAPYTAMTIAEYFRDTGRDVLVIMDDMSTHARFYREVSLISRKFPGRDSYPGDIFFIHARLLERAGNFIVGDKKVSITAIPVVETVQGDMTGYIQTNLMSMTDGHIYFDGELFRNGRRPPINPFLSVTRVGHQTQSPLRQEIGREVRSLLAEYEKTQGFLRFGAELGESSRQILALGGKVLAFFDQPPLSVIPTDLQIVLLGWIWVGLWDGKNLERILKWYQGNTDVVRKLEEMVSKSSNLSQLIAKVRENAEMAASAVREQS